MITNNKKRGRPASGIKKRFIAMRVTDDEASVVRECLRNARNGRITRLSFGDQFKGTDRKIDVVLQGPDESELRAQIKLLLDDAERAEVDIERLELEAEQAAMMSDDEKVVYWRNRCLACEGRKKGEFDQSV